MNHDGLSSQYPILYGKGGQSEKRMKSEMKKKVEMAGATDVGERRGVKCHGRLRKV